VTNRIYRVGRALRRRVGDSYDNALAEAISAFGEYFRGSCGVINTMRSEAKRNRGRMPIRKLFRAAGEALQRIKPIGPGDDMPRHFSAHL
jgi:hypothetical protein